MDLVEIYDRLHTDVGNRTDGLRPASGGMGTRWSPDYRLTDRARDIRQVDRDVVRTNNPDLAAELDSFEELHDAFGAWGDAVTEAFSTDWIRALDANTVSRVDAARFYRDDTGERYLTVPPGEQRYIVDEKIKISRWALLNTDPIVEAGDPEEFRYRLRENTDVTYHDLDAIYDGLDAQDVNGEAGDSAWYEEFWDFATESPFIEVDGERYTLREALQERAELNEEIAETASRLEPELRRNRQAALDQYRPGLATRIARRLRR